MHRRPERAGRVSLEKLKDFFYWYFKEEMKWQLFLKAILS